MAVTKPTYGSRTQLTLYTNLASLANNAAKVIGFIDNSSNLGDDLEIDFQATLNSAGVSATGSIELWLLKSPDNTAGSYTDGIDVTSTSDISASLKGALLVKTCIANATSQVVKERFTLPLAVAPKY